MNLLPQRPSKKGRSSSSGGITERETASEDAEMMYHPNNVDKLPVAVEDVFEVADVFKGRDSSQGGVTVKDAVAAMYH
jgi:hypothetical protein